jgi:manganese efflux pump family protein
MGFLFIVFIAFSLSFDSFAVSVSSGMSLCRKHLRLRDTMKIAGSLAVFQAIMPVIGWLLGSTVKSYIQEADHWIAFGLLSLLGIRMIIEGSKPHQEKIKNPTKWRVLIPLSIATSIDALAVGVGFSLLIENMLIPALIIGFVTFGVSLTGLYMGRNVGKKFAGKAEIVGGIILILIGIKILFEHLTTG